MGLARNAKLGDMIAIDGPENSIFLPIPAMYVYTLRIYMHSVTLAYLCS